MTSLVLTRFKPGTGNGGSALRNWQNIQGLGRLGPVDVVSIGDPGASYPVEGVRNWQHFPLADVIVRRGRLERLRCRLWRLRRGVHPSVEVYRHEEIARWLAGALRTTRYDVAVISEVFLASYLPLVKSGGCRVVFDCHNVESALAADMDAVQGGKAPLLYRLSMGLLQRRMFAEEQRASRQSDVVWACSERDAREIERLFGTPRPVGVVPNGVRVEAYETTRAIDPAEWERTPVTLVYPGSFSFFPNEDAALRLIREVLPAVRAKGHTARAVLVGRDPTESMRVAAAGDPDVVITGAVESILPYFHQPCIVTLPIRVGSGTRLKILEAFAAGPPVVSTAKGAEGIAGVDGEHLMVRDDPTGMAECVSGLWSDRALRSRISGNARALVREKYSWSAVAKSIAASLSQA